MYKEQQKPKASELEKLKTEINNFEGEEDLKIVVEFEKGDMSEEKQN